MKFIISILLVILLIGCDRNSSAPTDAEVTTPVVYYDTEGRDSIVHTDTLYPDDHIMLIRDSVWSIHIDTILQEVDCVLDTLEKLLRDTVFIKQFIFDTVIVPDTIVDTITKKISPWERPMATDTSFYTVQDTTIDNNMWIVRNWAVFTSWVNAPESCIKNREDFRHGNELLTGCLHGPQHLFTAIGPITSLDRLPDTITIRTGHTYMGLTVGNSDAYEWLENR